MDASKLIADDVQRRPYQPNKVLVAILDFGIQERALAELLGCTLQLVSLWKLGKRPINERWLPELYRILGTFIDSKQATIKILKDQGKWDAQMKRILNDRFKRAEKVYNERPAEYRIDQSVA